jgi:MFS family permease
MGQIGQPQHAMNAPPAATKTEVGLIYGTGLVQGLALVTFPAASSIFTSPEGYGFSGARYGMMFLPQVLLAILASSLAPKFAKRYSLKRVLVAGMVADLVSMSLLASSKFLLSSPDAAFGLLLIATGALGLGFGATLMALSTYTESFFPGRSDRAVLALNALLGTGTALAPLLIAVFLGLGDLVGASHPGCVRSGPDLDFRFAAAASIPLSRQREQQRSRIGLLPRIAVAVLALRGGCLSLWGCRDAQWKLGAALPQLAARRLRRRGLR